MALPRLGISVLALAALAASSAYGQSTPADPSTNTTITLANGDVLKGTIKSSDRNSVTLVHPMLGEIRIPRSKVASAEPALPPPPAPPPVVVETTSLDREKALQAEKDAAIAKAAAEAAKPTPPAPTVPEKPSLWTGLTRDDEKSFLVGWSRSAELGMSVSSGNSDAFSARASVSLRRATKKMATSVDASYIYARNNSGVATDRGEARGRNDFSLGDTNWQLWGAGSIEADQQTPWKFRLSLSTGPAYTFIKDPKTTLVGRVGLGGYREIDGGRNDIVANAVAAFDLSEKLTERASMYANTEIIPDVRDVEEFRSVSRAGISYLVDPETKTTIKLGAEHRYTTSPGTRDANDLNIFVTLGFTF